MKTLSAIIFSSLFCTLFSIKAQSANTPPTQPLNLSADSTTIESVVLKWDPSSDDVGVTGYIVYNGNDSVDFVTDTTYKVTGLNPSTTYSFSVKAIDIEGYKSEASDGVEVTTLAVPDNEAPTAPSNLASGNITGTSVHLTWTVSTDNVGVTGYIVYRDSDSIATVAAPSYDATGLTSATTYSFTIRAKDASGNKSEASNIVEVTTLAAPDTEAPTAPSNLASDNITGTSVNLTWTASTDNVGVTGYIVYRGPDSITTVITPSYDAIGLTSATTYSFTIRAKDAAGNKSAPSDANTITTLDILAPSAPSNPTISDVTSTSLKLSWTASTDNVGVTGYIIYRSNDSIATTTATSFDLAGLTPQTTYSFTIKAKDAAGNLSVASSAKSVTTLADTESPSAPMNLSSSNITDTGVRLTWTGSTDNINVTGYNIYKGTTLLTTVTALTYNVTGLTSATSYSFTVKAKDAAGNLSAASNEVSITTTDVIAPTAPSNLKSSNLKATSVTLTWTGSTDNVGVTGYNVYKGTVLVTTVTTLTYSVTGLTSATAYSFSVKAKDAAGNISGASNTISLTTLDNISPTSPTNLKTSKVTSNSILLNWTASTDNVGVTGYIVYRGSDSIATVTGLSYDVPGLNSATTYSFTVKAKDAAGNKSTTSNVLNVMTLDITAPTAPANLKYSDITITTVKLAWTASTDNIGVKGYIIYQGIDSVTTATATEFTVSGLTPSKQYSFTVKAKDAAGNISASSNIVTFTTPGEPDIKCPTTPENLQAHDTGTSSVRLTWNASTDNIEVTGYKVYLDNEIISTTPSLEYVIAGLEEVTKYSFYVMAYDAADNLSDTSNSITITTLKSPDLTAPTKPEDISLCSFSTEMLSFSWTESTDNEELEGYQIYVNDQLITTIKSTEFSLIGLLPNVTYIFYIVAIDKSGNLSEASEKIYASSNGIIQSGIDNNQIIESRVICLELGMKRLFLNMANNNGTIELADIYDINGKLISSSTSIINEQTISFEDLILNKGIYILVVSNKGIREATRFLIQ